MATSEISLTLLRSFTYATSNAFRSFLLALYGGTQTCSYACSDPDTRIAGITLMAGICRGEVSTCWGV